LIEVIHDHGLRIDSKGVVNRGEEFARVDWVFHRCGAGFVRFAMNVALLDTCSGDHASVAVGPVVASVGAVTIAGSTDAFLWAASEFPDGDDECLVEETSIFEI
jgi:hypothetical protein